MNSYDARVRYTRMVIEESFLALLHQKPLNRITVTELCQMAQINRATFYKHYLDIPDLMEKTEEKLFDQLKEMYRDQSNIRETFLKVMIYFKQEADRYMVLGTANGDPDLAFKTMDRCIKLAYPMTQNVVPQLAPSRQEMLHHALSFTIGGVLRHWLTNGMQLSPEELTELVFTLCGHIIEGVRQGKIAI